MNRPLVYHQPVMVAEVLAGLRAQPGGRYVDCTVGEGGHALAILEASSPGGRLLGIDADPEAIEASRRHLQRHAGSLALVNANFAQLAEVVKAQRFQPVQGVLLDLGLSSLQLEGERRGFSFKGDDPLDMRFSPEQDRTAAELVNSLSEANLVDLLFRLGEEPQARRIARAVVAARPLQAARQLAEVVERAVPRRGRRLHPATRVFQALRMAVNDELQSLEAVLDQVMEVLAPNGRLVVISYHSLEDRLVKQFLRHEARNCICPPEIAVCQCGHRARLRLITRRIITPSREEVVSNARSRSARLRAAEQI
jgi:16S rRNA (cytosine1402-N4)-methyltransferase